LPVHDASWREKGRARCWQQERLIPAFSKPVQRRFRELANPPRWFMLIDELQGCVPLLVNTRELSVWDIGFDRQNGAVL